MPWCPPRTPTPATDRGEVGDAGGRPRPAQRCAAAHAQDPSDCDGLLDAVRVVDQENADVLGCVQHGAVLLATLVGGRVYPGPGDTGGSAIDTSKWAQTLRPRSFERED